MTHLNGLMKLLPDNRLYEPIIQLIQLSASVAITVRREMGLADPTELSVNYQANQFPLWVGLPGAVAIRMGVRNKRPAHIEVMFISNEVAAQPPPPGDAEISEWSMLLELVGSMCFLIFYETNKEWMEDNLGTNVKKWPPVLNFARVIRNCISHSGQLYFKEETSDGASWHHITYAPEPNLKGNGRKIIGKEFYFADLVILMFEMAEELDRLNAPTVSKWHLS